MPEHTNLHPRLRPIEKNIAKNILKNEEYADNNGLIIMITFVK